MVTILKMTRLFQNCVETHEKWWMIPPGIFLGGKSGQMMWITAHNVKGEEHTQFSNYIDFFFTLETDRPENVRQVVVCERRRFDRLVRYTFSVFDWFEHIAASPQRC